MGRIELLYNASSYHISRWYDRDRGHIREKRVCNKTTRLALILRQLKRHGAKDLVVTSDDRSLTYIIGYVT